MWQPAFETGIPLFDSKQIKALELDYARLQETETYILMENAGKVAFEFMRRSWPEAKRVLILTGKGNNGGDGFVIARLAVEYGMSVSLCNFCEQSRLAGDAATAYRHLPLRALSSLDWDSVDLGEFDLIVDALLGTGIQGAVREPFDKVIRKVNQSPIPVLSLDIPSGLNADTGAVANVAVKADHTVTFIGHKKGLFTGDAPDYRGQVMLHNLGINDEQFSRQPISTRAHDWSSFRNHLRPRRPASHKGNNGHCKVIGGASGLTGAAVLAAIAAARSGSGLTSAWLESGANVLLTRQPEVMARNVELDEIEPLLAQLNLASSLIVGPGLGQQAWGCRWMESLLTMPDFIDTNKVVDADALNWLANHHHRNSAWVLTPHPGEAARLLGCSVRDISQDRFAASLQLAKKYGGVCVLKGAGTIVSNESGEQIVCAVGNPGMATGGMGDVLAGIIGGLLAQQMPLFEAAVMGVCIHGEAAQRAAGEHRFYRGMLAGDLFDYFPELLNPG